MLAECLWLTHSFFMPKTREQKGKELSDLQHELSGMKSMVVTQYTSLTVHQAQQLQKECRAVNVRYLTIKKNLLGVALKPYAWMSVESKSLPGSVSVMIAHEDEVAPAKVLDGFMKVNPVIQPLGGMLEGRWIDAAQVRALGKLPSRQELLGQAVGSIAAPLSGLVRTLSGVMRQFVYTLSAIQEKK